MNDRRRETARQLAIDIAIGVAWALMLAVTVLFVTGLSEFIYVDF